MIKYYSECIFQFYYTSKETLCLVLSNQFFVLFSQKTKFAIDRFGSLCYTLLDK